MFGRARPLAPSGSWRRALVLLLVPLAALAALTCTRTPPHSEPPAAAPTQAAPIASAQAASAPLPAGASAAARSSHHPTHAPLDSNIARADYVGPKVCGDCHADEYARWSQSLHRVMNARPSDPGAVIGDFSGTVVRYAGGEATFTRDHGDPVMILRRGDHEVRYRVTRTIGHRGLQEYVGIVDGRPAGAAEEVRLPFGWWPRLGGWYPQPYFDPWLGDGRTFDAYAEVTEPWATRCPWCHSTYPFAQRIARASGPDHLGHGLEQLFQAPPGGDRLAVDQQVTTGISCESCHLGGRVHADGGPIAFVPAGASRRPGAPVLPAAFADERRDAMVVNGVCAQCHSGPSPRLPDGTALRNSSEALDLGASPCRGIKCTDCHDPHRADSRAADTEARAVAACTHCHDALADAAAARAHAGSGHASTTCLDCHMPRLVMGIDRYVRTHRISSPTNPALLAVAAPNACNLCHLDRSITFTLTALADEWDVHISPRSGPRTAPRTWRCAYGALDAPVGEVWLTSKTPTLRLLAAHAYAASPLGRYALSAIERGLSDPLAYVRAWTALAIEQIRGGDGFNLTNL